RRGDLLRPRRRLPDRTERGALGRGAARAPDERGVVLRLRVESRVSGGHRPPPRGARGFAPASAGRGGDAGPPLLNSVSPALLRASSNRGGHAMPRVQKVTLCLWFDDQAEEAARFYTGIFAGSRILQVSRYGEAGREVHGKEPGSAMTVEFELDGQHFTALNG